MSHIRVKSMLERMTYLKNYIYYHIQAALKIPHKIFAQNIVFVYPVVSKILTCDFIKFFRQAFLCV